MSDNPDYIDCKNFCRLISDEDDEEEMEQPASPGSVPDTTGLSLASLAGWGCFLLLTLGWQGHQDVFGWHSHWDVCGGNTTASMHSRSTQCRFVVSLSKSCFWDMSLSKSRYWATMMSHDDPKNDQNDYSLTIKNTKNLSYYFPAAAVSRRGT